MQRLTLQQACLYGKDVRGAHLAGALRVRAAEPRGGREAVPLHARTPADMLRDMLGGEEPSAEAFLREVAPALVGWPEQRNDDKVEQS